MPSIVVSHVSYEFESSQPVLKDLCLQIQPGEFVVLAGPSGTGKTTLLTLIGALRNLQHGDITLAGRSLAGLRESDRVEIRRNIGFIFQDHHLFDALTSVQTLQLAMTLFPQRYRGDQLNSEPAEILNALDMSQCLHSKPGEMSSGQRQRVAIARALIKHPSVILADEPTAALDYDTASKVLELLRQRTRDEAVSILMVTHDRRIYEIADRVIQMIEGRIESAP